MLADRVAVIARGRVIACDVPVDAWAVATSRTATVSWREGDEDRARADRPSPTRARRPSSPPASAARCPALAVHRPSLEDVYLSLVGHDTRGRVMSTADDHDPGRARRTARRARRSACAGSASSSRRSSATATPRSGTSRCPMMLLIIFGSVFGNQNLGDGRHHVRAVLRRRHDRLGRALHRASRTWRSPSPWSATTARSSGIQGTPMPKVSYFLGKIGLVFVAYVAQVTLLIVVGVLFYDIELPIDRDPVVHLRLGSRARPRRRARCSASRSRVVPKNGKGASAVVSPIVLVLQFTSGRLLRLRAAARVDADVRVALPAQVAHAGHAQRVPARRRRRRSRSPARGSSPAARRCWPPGASADWC